MPNFHPAAQTVSLRYGINRDSSDPYLESANVPPGSRMNISLIALDQASLVLGRSQEIGDLLHIIIGHALQRRHPGVRELAEEMGDTQPELHASEVKPKANCRDIESCH